MPISIPTLVLIAAVVGLTATVLAHPEKTLREALAISWRQTLMLIPIVVPAIFAAGFIAELLPSEVIGALVGPGTGFQGAMIAAAFGGLMPTGPMIILPIASALLAADAGEAQICALMNGWSMINLQRLLLYDIPMAGPAITIRRYAAAVVLVPVAALLGLAIAG